MKVLGTWTDENGEQAPVIQCPQCAGMGSVRQYDGVGDALLPCTMCDGTGRQRIARDIPDTVEPDITPIDIEYSKRTIRLLHNLAIELTAAVEAQERLRAARTQLSIAEDDVRQTRLLYEEAVDEFNEHAEVKVNP